MNSDPLPLPAELSRELSPDVCAGVAAELARGNKLKAVKLVQQHTGLGLAQAKALVDGESEGASGDSLNGTASGQEPKAGMSALKFCLLALAASSLLGVLVQGLQRLFGTL